MHPATPWCLQPLLSELFTLAEFTGEASNLREIPTAITVETTSITTQASQGV